VRDGDGEGVGDNRRVGPGFLRAGDGEVVDVELVGAGGDPQVAVPVGDVGLEGDVGAGHRSGWAGGFAVWAVGEGVQVGVPAGAGDQ
jgi:hypothetical protein